MFCKNVCHESLKACKSWYFALTVGSVDTASLCGEIFSQNQGKTDEQLMIDRSIYKNRENKNTHRC